MRLLPDTLARRVMLLMALSLSIFHFGSIYLYQAGLQFVASSAREQQLSERLVSIRRSIAEQPPAKREEAAHGLSTASVDIHWSEISLVNEVVTTNQNVLDFKQQLLSAQPGELTEVHIRLGYADEGVANAYQGQNSHIMLVSLSLPDNSWVNYAITELPLPGQHGHGTLVSIAIMAIGIILVSLLVVRMFNAPLRDLAAAAERVGRDLNAPGLPETGPQEVRVAARAFMGHKVTTSLPDTADFVGRPLAMRRAFSNLIDNAIKYGNEANITLQSEPETYRIRITDTGPGISEESRAQVFEPFYRLESSRNSATGGTGLGMTIAHTAITAHNGQIKLENLTQGGLLVEVILPRPITS